MDWLTNLASFGAINFFEFLIYEGFRSKNYDLEYEQVRRNKTRTYLKKIKFIIISAGDSRKISLKIFKQEMRKIFKIFPNSFDQKSQKMSHDFSKSI
jgi:hypothetical protein